MPGAFSLEWYGALLREKLGALPDGWEDVDGPQALAWSRDLGIPLHPRHNLFFHDLTVEELTRLRELIGAHGRIDDGRLVVPGDEEPREWLPGARGTEPGRGEGGGAGGHPPAPRPPPRTEGGAVRCVSPPPPRGGARPPPSPPAGV